MNILFWNTHGNPNINSYLASIIKDNAVDIVVLAEYIADGLQLKRLIRNNGRRFKEYMTGGCSRIRIFGSYSKVAAGNAGPYYSIQIINNSYILCGVHLPSRSYTTESVRDSKIREIMYDIHTNEVELNSAKTIIVGDFNEMPYDYGCLAADTLHGLPIFEKGSDAHRTVAGTKFKKYYNPMWNFFGDFSYPYGTYYYTSSQDMTAPRWYIFDQFVLGSELASCVTEDDVKIITDCSNGSLADSQGHPDKKLISDHFPIFCRIEEANE